MKHTHTHTHTRFDETTVFSLPFTSLCRGLLRDTATTRFAYHSSCIPPANLYWVCGYLVIYAVMDGEGGKGTDNLDQTKKKIFLIWSCRKNVCLKTHVFKDRRINRGLRHDKRTTTYQGCQAYDMYANIFLLRSITLYLRYIDNKNKIIKVSVSRFNTLAF